MNGLVRYVVRLLCVCALLPLSACENPETRWDRFTDLLAASLSDFKGESTENHNPYDQTVTSEPSDIVPENTARIPRYVAQLDSNRLIDRPWQAASDVMFLPGTLLVLLDPSLNGQRESILPRNEVLAGGQITDAGAGLAANPTDKIQNLFSTLDLTGRVIRHTPVLWQIDFQKRGINPTRLLSPNLDFECRDVRQSTDLAVITACVQQALFASGAFTHIERDFIFQPAYRLAAPTTQIPARQSGFSFSDGSPTIDKTMAILTGPVWGDHPDLHGAKLVKIDGANLPRCNTPLGIDGTPTARPYAVNLTIMNKCGARLSVLIESLLIVSRKQEWDGIPLKSIKLLAMPFALAHSCPDTLQYVVETTRRAGINILAASGEHRRQVKSVAPAGCAGVISITAMGADARLTPSANYGPNIDILAFGGRLDRFVAPDIPSAHLVPQYAELCQSRDPAQNQTVFACYDGWGEGSGLALMQVLDAYTQSGMASFKAWLNTLSKPSLEQCFGACEAYVGSLPIAGQSQCQRPCGSHYLPYRE